MSVDGLLLSDEVHNDLHLEVEAWRSVCGKGESLTAEEDERESEIKRYRNWERGCRPYTLCADRELGRGPSPRGTTP
jgi:hypothetical protein